MAIRKPTTANPTEKAEDVSKTTAAPKEPTTSAAPKTRQAKTPTPPVTPAPEPETKVYELEDSNILLRIINDGTKTMLVTESDLSVVLGPSKSGKSDMIAATTGVAGIELPDMPGYCLQLKLYKMHEKPSRPGWKKAQ